MNKYIIREATTNKKIDVYFGTISGLLNYCTNCIVGGVHFNAFDENGEIVFGR